jgi:integrase/recombinase XerC
MLFASEFLQNCTQVREFSERTVASYADTIEDFEEALKISDPREVTTRDIDHYLSRKFLAGQSPATRRSRLYGLRSFFRFLFTRGYIDDDPAEVVLPPREKRGAIPTFTEKEIEKMAFGCQPLALTKGTKEHDFAFARRRRIHDAKFDRDSAIVALCYANALRADEVGKIRNEHYWLDGNGVPALIVMGKRATEPTRMRVDKEVARLIDRWLGRRVAQGIESEYLFCAAKAGASDGISARHVLNIVRDRVALARVVQGKRRLSPHVFRYSRATHMYAATRDIVVVSSFLRHKSVETTIRYIRLGSLSQQAKVATVSLPWNRKGLEDLI